VRYHKKIRRSPLPADPIFIIGHWRTGSTFLHQLMSKDPNLTTPTLFQVAIPDSFLCSYNYYRPIMNAVVSKFRPMDKVMLGMNEPQEDEYAIYRITDFSPLEKLVFPVNGDYFLLDSGSFLPPENEIREWSEKLSWFFRKLHYKTGKTIVSKNPFNSLRIKELTSIFPGARFVHIIRHPFDVVPSTIHMWNIVQQQNVMRPDCCKPRMADVITVMDRVLNTIRHDLESIPENRRYEIRFEQLEKDPLDQIRKLYAAFNLPFSQEAQQNMESFINRIRGFEKNHFTLTEQEKDLICDKLKNHMEYFGYQNRSQRL
jgi:omega-hydroxy-beta-dihydromenaquinone-9 sulfotransferase